MAEAPNEVQLFEVNLISDQISALMRRRAYQQLSGLATVLMIAAGTALAFVMAMHLTTALKMRTGTQNKVKELQDLQNICAQLDAQRDRATQRANAVAPLLPIARQRVAWAPKLAAIARDLPPGAGVVNIQATQRDIFVVPASTVPKPAASSGFSPQDEAGLPQMAISILCRPSSAAGENLGLFSDRLKKDETFMIKFDPNGVYLLAMEQDNWENRPVEILHFRAQGTPK